MVRKAEHHRWSSARAHLEGKDDCLVKVQPMLDRVDNRAEFLASDDKALYDKMRMHEQTGRPLGQECFVAKLSSLLDRELGKRKPGSKWKDN